MTQEEKAKAYDEALEDLRVIYPNLRGDAKLAVEHAFPQLTESEDERIRKHLIEIVETYWGKTNEPGKAADLAWLEKRKEPQHAIRATKGFGDPDGPQFELVDLQKEQKPAEWSDTKELVFKDICKHLKEEGYNGWVTLLEALHSGEFKQPITEWSKEDENKLNHILEIVHIAPGSEASVDEKEELESFIKSLHPQPKQEWSEDYREEDLRTRFAFYTYKDEDGVLYLSNVFVEETSRNHGFGTRILRAAEKVAETIGATTISLKVKQDSPANAWYRKNGYGYVAFEDGYDWLEKNLEYMKPNKREWSEEDEERLDSIIESYKELLKDYKACHDVDYIPYNSDTVIRNVVDDVNFLKSLRPQPHKWYIKKGHWYMCIVDKPEYGWTKGKVYQSPEDNRIKTNYKGSLTNWPNSEPWFRPATYREIPDNQPSWKPSEDEERLINTSISFLKDFADKGYENAVECIDWLKSKLNGNSGK